MASELVKRLLAANEGSQQALMGSDIFYKAAERIDFLERQLEKIAEPIAGMENEAERRGCKLDGRMAVELSKDPTYYQQIAKAALRAQ